MSDETTAAQSPEKKPLHLKRNTVGGVIGYNVSLVIFGGTAPLVSTWLISRTGDIAAPAYYLMAMALVSLVAVLLLRAPHGEELT